MGNYPGSSVHVLRYDQSEAKQDVALKYTISDMKMGASSLAVTFVEFDLLSSSYAHKPSFMMKKTLAFTSYVRLIVSTVLHLPVLCTVFPSFLCYRNITSCAGNVHFLICSLLSLDHGDVWSI